jgi:hypothetical protein
MKFGQAYQDVMEGNTGRVDSVLSQEVTQWIGHNPNGAVYPTVLAEKRYDIRTCQCWVQNMFFVDINGEQAALINSPIGINQYRQGFGSELGYRPVAMPVPELFESYQGEVSSRNLTVTAASNDRFWGVHSLAALCTTTTSTTLPPCPCAGNHPDMRVTIAGIQSTNYTPCTLTNDSFCTALNRTWCLLFRGFDYSFNGSIGKIWYRDQYIPVCYWEGSITYGVCIFGGLTYSSARVRLTYPTPPWGATDSCNFARLNVGDAANYMSNDFNPDTGGTFTLESTSNLCSGVPTSLTVTVQASCTTTTSTTSTTSTTGPP